jgi:CDP-glucose 4,6-dehydratase
MENLVTLKNFSNYYKDKKVFITGHTGFKGSWLMACLDILGAKIKGYALPPEYDNNIYDHLIKSNKIESVLADIRDKNELKNELLSFNPDFIFHLAAQPLVRRSYEIPAETFEINVGGTANLLEAAIDLPGKCTIIVITTDKVYENKEKDVLYKEDDALGGFDPYSASKACAEFVVSSFRNSFFNLEKYQTHKKAVASIRAGNVIGGGDRSNDRLIPDIVRSLEKGNTIEVRNPKSVRPWQHVLEPLTGYLLTAALINENPKDYSPAFNFGPESNDHLTVKECVEAAIEYWGAGNWKDCSDPKQPHEAGLLKLDIARAKKELNWKPKLNTKQAIKWTLDWYKQNPNNQAEFTYQQIKEYLSL